MPATLGFSGTLKKPRYPFAVMRTAGICRLAWPTGLCLPQADKPCGLDPLGMPDGFDHGRRLRVIATAEPVPVEPGGQVRRTEPIAEEHIQACPSGYFERRRIDRHDLGLQ